MYYSHDEIFDQGRLLRQEYDVILAHRDALRAFFQQDDYDEIVCLACGSSYWASLSAAMTISRALGKRCTAVKSGDVVLDRDHYRTCFSRPLVIAPSRSGNTSETLLAVELFRECYKSRVYTILEYEEAKLAPLSDLTISIPFMNETSVCQTRSFSAMYLGMVLSAAVVAGDEALLSDLDAYLTDFASHSRAAEGAIEGILHDFPTMTSMVALGHGPQYGVVIEGAYINIEMAQLPAHYYATLEWRHGPIVLADEGYLVCMTCAGPSARALEESMAQDTQNKRAKVLAISDTGDFQHADFQISLGRPARAETTALFSVMVMQGFAYYNALRKGIDPDSPVELVPWISI